MLSNLCGDCNACCERYTIPDVFWSSEPKPRNALCEKWCNGCSIYEERPQACKDFECVWLLLHKARDGKFPVSLRPDNTGVMVVTRDPQEGYDKHKKGQIIIEEVKPGAFDRNNITPEQLYLLSELAVLVDRQEIPTTLYFRSYDWKISKMDVSVEHNQCQ